jgi:hypothetical protein
MLEHDGETGDDETGDSVSDTNAISYAAARPQPKRRRTAAGGTAQGRYQANNPLAGDNSGLDLLYASANARTANSSVTLQRRARIRRRRRRQPSRNNCS